MDAVNDGTKLQILYEGRTADTALKDKSGFDAKFEDCSANAQRKKSQRSKRSTARVGTPSKPSSGLRRFTSFGRRAQQREALESFPRLFDRTELFQSY